MLQFEWVHSKCTGSIEFSWHWNQLLQAVEGRCSNWCYFSLSFRSSLAYSASPGSQPPLPESLRCFSSSLSLSLWSCCRRGSWWARQSFRHFGAKPDKKICRRSGGEAEFMGEASHGRLDGMVVEV